MSTANDARKQLGKLLASLADIPEIALVLGITQPMPESFWETQLRTVKTRFFSYTLNELGLPLTLERTELSEETTALVFLRAHQLLESGITYEEVRNWWKCQGTYLHNAQFAAKHELEQLAKSCIRVLVFFSEGRPLYLAFDDEHKPKLVPDVKDAFQFPVHTLSQKSDKRLKDDAEDFKGYVSQLGATHVKLLPGQRT